MAYRLLALVAVLSVLAPIAPVAADVVPVDVPVLSEEVPRGSGSVTSQRGGTGAHTIDGSVGDWAGTASRFGGTTVYSHGELVYQDHLFDAYGADDGSDRRRLATLDPLTAEVPETYRLDPLYQANIAGQFGISLVDQLEGETHYGDLEHSDASDLVEVRLAPAGRATDVLARTTTMETANDVAVLVLVDRGGPEPERTIPFGSGLVTDSGDEAFLISGGLARAADLRSGDVSELPAGSVAVDPSGYTNAVEARLPFRVGRRTRIAVASGPFDPATGGFADSGLGANVANVAFREGEPVREWFEKRQALALQEGSIDGFFVEPNLSKLRSGVAETYVPEPGYHERLFVSGAAISQESGRNGIWQRYGVFLPSTYEPTAELPLQLWLHWRGGSAHAAGALTPRIFKHLGEDQDAMVVSPEGRGTSRWYVGKGHVDYREVWADVMQSFPVDRDRVYVSGHSMGGWGSYLLSILYPDRFAAAMPVAGPVTQGAWTGVDFAGCDEFSFDGATPCYISANGGDPRVQHTRRLLDNVRNVPLSIYHGAVDELVPTSGVTRQVERLIELGYRHRYYLFETYEHYSHPIVDEWIEGGRYMHSFERDPNPARVTYIRDMPFERATETVQSDGVPLNFDFDSAYWMSGLAPVDEDSGVARFDGRSLALAAPGALTVPEAGGPTALGQSGPYSMTGLSWEPDPTATKPQAVNAFEASLTGANSVTMDLARMGIDVGRSVTGSIETDEKLELRLTGAWESTPGVTVNGEGADAVLAGGTLTIVVPAGESEVVVEP